MEINNEGDIQRKSPNNIHPTINEPSSQSYKTNGNQEHTKRPVTHPRANNSLFPREYLPERDMSDQTQEHMDWLWTSLISKISPEEQHAAYTYLTNKMSGALQASSIKLA